MKKMVAITALLIGCALPAFAQCETRWGYTGNKGPLFWGSLAGGAFRTCETGTRQSPIAIQNLILPDSTLPQINVTLTNSRFSVRNPGYELQVIPVNTWQIQWFGRTATLTQFHFHRPAEHLDGNVRHPGEIHFVFQDAQGKLIVIAVWIKEGARSDELQRILNRKPTSCITVQPTNDTIKITDFLKTLTNYAAYQGSLTTPACNEIVTFLVTRVAMEANAGQIANLNVAQVPYPPGNARPLQPYTTVLRQ